MARDLLTATSLESKLKEAAAQAAQKKTRVRVADGNNLYLVVRANGTASWQLLVTVAGKRKPHTLGKWPDVTLKRARMLADEARGLAMGGTDPVEKKRLDRVQRTEQAQADLTVRRLMVSWLDKHTGSSVYIGNIQAAFAKDVLPEIGALHPGVVERRHIIAIMRKMERRGALVMLRRLRMWLKQMFEFALDAELVQASPVPTGHLKSFMTPVDGHFPAITNSADVGPLMRAIDGYSHPVIRLALLLSAHLFQRPTEIREAKWEEFDLEAKLWTIPANRMKLNREHWVPLSPQAVGLLKQLQGIVGDEGWMFPGRRFDRPLSEAALGAALETLGYDKRHTPHGFRAMAHTMLTEQLEVDERFIEKQLSHEEVSKVKRAYNRAEYIEKRVAMMSTWSEWLDARTRDS